MSDLDSFNRIAPFYDSIKTLVFGQSLDRAWLVHLPVIRPGDRVLILGGGTGSILERLLDHQPILKITYIEASSRMLDFTRRRLEPLSTNSVTLVHGTATDLGPTDSFDIIITNFVLDLFDSALLNQVAAQLHLTLRSGGHWILTDFIPRAQWSRWDWLFVRVMYLFFYLTTGLKTRDLPDFNHHFKTGNYRLVASAVAVRGLVTSLLYQKHVASVQLDTPLSPDLPVI